MSASSEKLKRKHAASLLWAVWVWKKSSIELFQFAAGFYKDSYIWIRPPQSQLWGIKGSNWVRSSSLSFKETCTKTGRCEQSCFWQGKKGVVLHNHWGILTKVCYRHFMKTLNSGSNVSKKQTGFLRHYVPPPIFIFRFVFPQHLIDLNCSF